MRKTFGILLFALTASTAAAQDPASISPDDYKVEIDNEWVRVLRVKQAPGAKTRTYQTDELITVYLHDSHEKFTNGQGRSQEVRHAAGQIMHSSAGKRSQENMSDKPLEKIMIVVKPFAPKHGMPPANLDPVKLEPEHVKVLFENEMVRVLETTLVRGYQNPLHAHPHNVVTFIRGPLTMTDQSGKTVPSFQRPGNMRWVEASQHATKNNSDTEVLEIQVEIK